MSVVGVDSAGHVRHSAVILTCDRPGELTEMLMGLAVQTIPIGQYVVVNNSADEEPTRTVLDDFARARRAPLIYLRGDPLFGTASGRNAGLAQAAGDIVFLFDDDLIFPDRFYVERVQAIFEADANGTVGAVTTASELASRRSPLRAVQGGLRRLAKAFFGMDGPRPGSVCPSGFQVQFPRTAADVDWIQGGLTAVRAEVARTVRFDERLEHRPVALSEDIDYGLQIRRTWRIVYAPQAVAINGHARRGGTVRQWLSDEARYELIVRNYDRINRQHRPGRTNRAAFWWAMAGIGLERLLAWLLGSGGGLRGYRRGLRAVLRGGPGARSPRRRVERLTLGVDGQDGQSEARAAPDV